MPQPSRLLVANRGEVAVRIARACRGLGIAPVGVHARDERRAAHLAAMEAAALLPGSGAGAFLDADALVAAAVAEGCDALHPGYGFLSERAELARACAAAGLTFVGPEPATLEVFGDKLAARELALAQDVPVLHVGEPGALLTEAGAVMVKARAGGGGRGTRVVRRGEHVGAAVARARSEALAAFGDDAVYAEELLEGARHVEVQLLGDGTGEVAVLGDRDCTLQARRQKLVELAPAPDLDDALRTLLHDGAARMGGAAALRGLATIEYLVAGDRWVFLEGNPRLQVEHTVTEEVAGLDLVRLGLHVAGGATLADLGLGGAAPAPPPSGIAVEVRVSATGAGRVEALSLPSGPGVRVDTALRVGSEVSGAYDPLLLKLVVHERDGGVAEALGAAARALGELVLDGVATNAAEQAALLDAPEVRAWAVDTGWVDARDEAPVASAADGAVRAPVTGRVVAAGPDEVVVEAMKMEHVMAAPTGAALAPRVAAGDAVRAGDVVAILVGGEGEAAVGAAPEDGVDLDHVRADLAAVLDRHALGLDAARGEAVARRHATGRRTAREDLADLVDEGTYVEYGPLVFAAQESRRPREELIARTPADGIIAGIGDVDGDPTVVLTYDYTVMAGTQGMRGHHKKDRLFALAEARELPVVLFAEGGGGRPGDVDLPLVSALDTRAFALFARLSGLVPTVGIAGGRCFAGNAALLGCCDVVIATEDATIGMGGPAMIEGGGLGTFAPEEVGPIDVQWDNGVVDLRVADQAAAVAAARQLLACFRGPVVEWTAGDQRALRTLIPEQRKRAYDVRAVIAALGDEGSVLELRRGWGAGVVTALVRVEGEPLGLLANDPTHLGGALDADAADKAARFLGLCDAHRLPVLTLCDTPGFMVGPDAERSATVRHVSRMFVGGANVTVPLGTIILRKAYGLGAQAMMGGSTREGRFCVGWPTSELGAMGLEGAVRLGMRRELEAIEDEAERAAAYEAAVAAAYEHGQGMNAAAHWEIDDVIDPADSRRWIRLLTTEAAALRADRPHPHGKSRPYIDTW